MVWDRSCKRVDYTVNKELHLVAYSKRESAAENQQNYSDSLVVGLELVSVVAPVPELLDFQFESFEGMTRIFLESFVDGY